VEVWVEVHTVSLLAGAALDGQVEGEPVRGGRDRRGGVAVVLLHPGADVAGDVVVHEVGRSAGGLDADHRRQELVADPDPVDGVLGDVAVLGDHERDRLADVVDLVPGERELGAAVGECGVRDQQGQRVGHHAVEVVVRPDGVHAVEVEDVRDVDVEDPGVGVRRAEDGGVQGGRPDEHVVDVAAATAEEALVLDARHLLAEELRGHEAPPWSSAARRTAATMFW
jgi:hypothetical protein